jgi:hypothetical protein
VHSAFPAAKADVAELQRVAFPHGDIAEFAAPRLVT